MPNWCVGTLKLRGSKSNRIKAIENEFEAVSFLGETTTATIGFNEYDYLEVYGEHYTLWLKGSRRHFIECPNDIYLGDENVTVIDGFKGAWDIDVDPLQALSEKYLLDIKIFAFEMGQQFCRDIEIHNGTVIKNEVVRYDNWEWDCVMPNMGG